MSPLLRFLNTAQIAVSTSGLALGIRDAAHGVPDTWFTITLCAFFLADGILCLARDRK